MPTALELTREQWRRYVGPAHRSRAPTGLTPLQQQERDQLLQRVREAAVLLKGRLHPRRVVLFGSLAHGAWFQPGSDIDLAIEGLSGDAYWQAWKMLEELITDRSVDLVEIETAGRSLESAIRQSGIEL
jgi:uncharacterized protein